MTTSPSPGATSPSTSSGAFPSSLPRWRQFFLGACYSARHLGATLNWRRDPDYEQRVMLHEQRMNENRIAIERSKERIKQIETEILQVRNDSERIEKDTEQIEKETEQLRRENAREKALSASIKRLCFPPKSCSIPQTPIEPRLQTFLALLNQTPDAEPD